jgi:hypothetical protein
MKAWTSSFVRASARAVAERQVANYFSPVTDERKTPGILEPSAIAEKTASRLREKKDDRAARVELVVEEYIAGDLYFIASERLVAGRFELRTTTY